MIEVTTRKEEEGVRERSEKCQARWQILKFKSEMEGMGEWGMDGGVRRGKERVAPPFIRESIDQHDVSCTAFLCT